TLAERDDVTVNDHLIDLRAYSGGIVDVGHSPRSNGGGDLVQRLPVVRVSVRGDHSLHGIVTRDLEHPVGLTAGVDDDLVGGVPAPQDVAIGIQGADHGLGHDQIGQLVDGGRAARLGASGVR